MSDQQQTGARPDATAAALANAARALRRARLWLIGTALAAGAFAPFAYAGPVGDLGYAGYLLLAAGVPAGLGIAAVQRRRASRWLSGWGGCSSAGRLLEALTDTDPDVRAGAESALRRVLASPRADAGLRLEAPQYEALLSVLPVASPGLMEALSALLEAVGDHRAHDALEAALSSLGGSPAEQRARSAGERALQAITERGAAPSPDVRQDGAVLAAAAEPAPRPPDVLAGLLSADPGVRSVAMRDAAMLDTGGLDAVAEGLSRRIRGLRVRRGLRGALALLVPLALTWMDAAALGVRDIAALWRAEAGNLVGIVPAAALFAWPLVGSGRRLREMRAARAGVRSLRVETDVSAPGVDEPSALAAQLESGEVGIRAQALRRVRALPAPEAAAVGEVLAAKLYPVQRERRLRAVLSTAGPLLGFALGELCLLGTPMWRHWANHVQDAGWWLALGAWVAWPLAGLSRQTRQLMSTFAALDTPAVCGALLAAAGHGDRTVRRRALGALERLLPRAAPDDLAVLTRRHVSRMERMLGEPRPGLARALMDALVQVGDRATVARLEALAGEPASAPLPPELAAAAADAARRLAARLDAIDQERALLRPAAPPPSDAALVRPAAGAGPSSPDTLLRPSAGARSAAASPDEAPAEATEGGGQ